MISEEYGKKIDELKKAVDDKQYARTTGEIAIMIMCSDEMRERKGEPKETINSIIQLCKDSRSAPEFLQAVLDYGGINNFDK